MIYQKIIKNFKDIRKMRDSLQYDETKELNNKKRKNETTKCKGKRINSR